MMSKKFLRLTPPRGISEMDDVRWGRTLAHELGHYVFWLGDEYMDWRGNSYYWDYITCDDFACYPERDVYYAAPDSVMKNDWVWSELSTPKDYEEFHKYLNNTYGDWKPYTTDQWGNTTRTNENSDEVDPGIWHSSAWETVYKILTGDNLKIKACIPQKDFNVKGSIPCSMKTLVLENKIYLDFTPTSEFTPKTGPYTGVSYFMEVIWG
ncbi:ImmA/IrrE family metallo-endopeptidase [Thermococcus sp. Bubb.Bath]|uniref:ImmA/IrrE family metallo-endopeptidase n=1 Tax=Thermococcus sp. Bubb.Bath TaxID=1638242 RepID=UPI00143B0450|nr:hypothetical protein [Thermococcus sp. Bubb.Bath]NJF25509.1 hypothetical protein [Thermococcus sp. Bubb.Bath]